MRGAAVELGVDPWPAPVTRGTGTDGTGTDGTGTDGTGTDGNGTDGNGTGGAGTDGVVTGGRETRDGTLTVPAGVGIVTDGAATDTEGTLVLGTDSASAAPEPTAVAISTLSASERAIRIVRDMCVETHRSARTCANPYDAPQSTRMRPAGAAPNGLRQGAAEIRCPH